MSDQELLLRSAVVVLIGSVQAYLSDLVDEKCDNLPADWASLSDVQQRYIAVHALRTASELVADYQEADLIDSRNVKKLMNDLADLGSWRDKPDEFSRTVSKRDVQGFLSNNGTKALDRAISLHRAEIRFQDWLGQQPPYRDMLDRLDNVIQLRNDVAHGIFARRVTERDARKYVVLVIQLVRLIEEYLS